MPNPEVPTTVDVRGPAEVAPSEPVFWPSEIEDPLAGWSNGS